MSGVRIMAVGPDEGEQRLDRWFRRHFPKLGHGRLEKLLRTGQIRVDGRRARAGQRLQPGETVRIPPVAGAGDHGAGPGTRPGVGTIAAGDDGGETAALLRRAVLYRDEAVLVLNKPPGLASQGGSGIRRSVDGALEGLRFGAAVRPRLVHRLDRETSGVLVLARDAAAARRLTAAFRARDAEKLYWALVVGVPSPAAGRIDLPLAKLPGPAGERMQVDREQGRRAITDYRVVERIGRRAAWLALYPRTGRTHQLRAHLGELGTPILGDGKYGSREAVLEGQEVGRGLHLHARAIRLPHPDGSMLAVAAPLPEHMARSWSFLELRAGDGDDPAGL